MIYLLIIVLTNSSMCFVGGPPTTHQIVSSPEEATVKLWERAQTLDMYDHLEGKLYQIDIEKGVAKQVDIPHIEFKKKSK